MLSVSQTSEFGTPLVRQMNVRGSMMKKDWAKITEPKFNPLYHSEFMFLSCIRITMSFLVSIALFLSELP